MQAKPTVFTTDTCSKCPAVKKWMAHKGIEYNEVNITNDISLIKPASDISGMFTVPQTLAPNGVVIVGPNYGKLAQNIINDR